MTIQVNPDPLVGVEIEFQGVASGAFDPLKRVLSFQVKDDGSVRGPTYGVVAGPNNCLYVIPPREPGSSRFMVCAGLDCIENIGAELVTVPYPADQMMSHLEYMSSLFGHLDQTPRTSIHFHIDVANMPWTYVRNVIQWAYALEAIIFRLSAGGGIHRGERLYEGVPVDHMYARPLSSPICYENTALRSRYERIEDRARPVIDTAGLMTAASATAFARAWGRMDLWGCPTSLSRYNPHRLHFVNFVSVLKQGTLEWRICDALYDRMHHLLRFILAIHTKIAADPPPPEFRPLLLGAPCTLTCADVCDLLGADISNLWGDRWVEGCVSNARVHHYRGFEDLSPYMGKPTRRLANNNEDVDDGSDTFPFYVR